MNMQENRGNEVIIVGGGLAGLSAASRLTQQGMKVTLLEARTFLGGRVFSYKQKETGEVVDNGQHVYATNFCNLFHYLQTVGAEDNIHFPEPKMGLLHPEYGYSILDPDEPFLAKLWKYLNLEDVSVKDKVMAPLAVVRMLMDVARGPERLFDLTIDEWLVKVGMPKSLRNRFLDVALIGVMNEKVTRASAGAFIQVLKFKTEIPGFNGKIFKPKVRPGSVGYPKTDFHTAFIKKGINYIEANGGKVLTGKKVETVELDESRLISGIRCKDGSFFSGSSYIFAIPPVHLSKLVENNELAKLDYFNNARHFQPSPIMSFHIWFDKPLNLETEINTILASDIEVFLDRNSIAADRNGPGYYYQAVTSAAGHLVNLPKKDLQKKVMDVIYHHFPESKNFELIHFAANKEPNATSSLRPGTERFRCDTKSPIKNLFLAGDWTNTELPCTMESACKSGHAGAHEVMKYIKSNTSEYAFTSPKLAI